MKTIKNFVILTREELAEIRKEAHDNGFETGGHESKKKIEELETSVRKKNKELTKVREDYQDYEEYTDDKIKRLEETVEILNEERDEVRAVVKREIELGDLKTVLDARKEAYDKKDAKLKDREARVGSEEEGEYKRGYADGVSDGVRKIHEVTAKDREDAMKVAMVAAASHTPVANMKEINSAHQLTAGSSNQEA